MTAPRMPGAPGVQPDQTAVRPPGTPPTPSLFQQIQQAAAAANQPPVMHAPPGTQIAQGEMPDVGGLGAAGEAMRLDRGLVEGADWAAGTPDLVQQGKSLWGALKRHLGTTAPTDPRNGMTPGSP